VPVGSGKGVSGFSDSDLLDPDPAENGPDPQPCCLQKFSDLILANFGNCYQPMQFYTMYWYSPQKMYSVEIATDCCKTVGLSTFSG